MTLPAPVKLTGYRASVSVSSGNFSISIMSPAKLKSLHSLQCTLCFVNAEHDVFQEIKFGNFQAVRWLQSMLPLQVLSLGGELRSQGPLGQPEKKIDSSKKKFNMSKSIAKHRLFFIPVDSFMFSFPLALNWSYNVCLEAHCKSQQISFRCTALLQEKRHGLQPDNPCAVSQSHWTQKD